MIAVIPVRDGVAPAGADEAICEASGQAIIIGSGTPTAAETLSSVATHLWLVETDIHAAKVVAALENINRSHDSLILPATPDGRDLAPHLAHALGRPLYAGSISISDNKVSVSRNGGLSIVDFMPHQAFVATLQIGIRGTENISSNSTITPINIASVSRPTSSVTSMAVLPRDA